MVYAFKPAFFESQKAAIFELGCTSGQHIESLFNPTSNYSQSFETLPFLVFFAKNNKNINEYPDQIS